MQIQSPFLPRERKSRANRLKRSTARLSRRAGSTNPFASPLALYLSPKPVSDVLVKLAGDVTPDPEHRSDLLDLQEHAAAALRRPETAVLRRPARLADHPAELRRATRRMRPLAPGLGPSSPASASFQITSGAGGQRLRRTPAVRAVLHAGRDQPRPARSRPLRLKLARPDADQAISARHVHLPPGWRRCSASVRPCREPQAASGQCGPESEIGHASSSCRPRLETHTRCPAELLLTATEAPTAGGPFGLLDRHTGSAGPFHLGNVIVRSSIKVDPSTAAVSITTTLPTMVSTAQHLINGIPVQLKDTYGDDRPPREAFQFNPTNCNPPRSPRT